MSPEDIVKAIIALAPDKCLCFLEDLPLALPLEALVKLGENVYKAIEAANEKEAMQVAVAAVDADVDILEANDLKLGDDRI